MRLQGRRVLITGAASGIGRAIAGLFAQEGAAVALLDRDAQGLAQVVAGLRETRHTCMAAEADVSDSRQVRDAVGRAVKELGGLDGVVNSAGIDLMRPLDEMEREDWERVLSVNLTGPYLVCHEAIPALKAAGKGTIVNISSGAGLRPLVQRTAYCASKAGLVMMGKALAIELAPHGIRVNAICPGIIDTPLFHTSFEQAPDPEAEFAKIMERYVIKRVGQPEEIGHAALYLTSEESAFVTGIALAVDGGRTFH